MTREIGSDELTRVMENALAEVSDRKRGLRPGLAPLARVNFAISDACQRLEVAGTEAFADEGRYFEAMTLLAQAGGIIAGEEQRHLEEA
jgi:hypothetical protein